MGNQEKIILCDTNIILEFFKGNDNVVRQLKAIQSKNIRISIVTSMEIVYGSLNKRELEKLIKALGKLTVYQITPTISELAYELMQSYSLSHNLDIPDALIAATAIEHDISLFTHNLKHFRYLTGLELYTPD